MIQFPNQQVPQIQQNTYQVIQKIDNNCQIYVGDLDNAITEEMIWLVFKKFGSIKEIKIKKDRRGKSYGKISYSSVDQAQYARQMMNHERIPPFGPVLVTKVYTKEELENIRKNNIFIRNIPPQETEKSLENFFSQFGNIYSLKIKKNVKENQKDYKNEQNDKSNLAYGYIAFENQNDINKLMEQYENNKQKFIFHEQELFIQRFKQQFERELKKNNLYLKEFISQEDQQTSFSKMNEQEKQLKISKWKNELKQKCEQFGTVLSMVVSIDEKLDKPYAFVCFEKESDAQNFLQAQQNKDLEQQKIFASIHQHNKAIDERFILIQNLKKEVTKEIIYNSFKQFGEFTISRLQIQKSNPDCQSATIVFQRIEDSREFLVQVHKDKYNKLNALFNGGKCKTITLHLTKQLYYEYIQARKSEKAKLKKNSNQGTEKSQSLQDQNIIPQIPLNPNYPQYQMPMMYPFLMQPPPYRFMNMNQQQNQNYRQAGQQNMRQQNFNNQNYSRPFQQRQPYNQRGNFQANMKPHFQQQQQQNFLNNGQPQGIQQMQNQAQQQQQLLNVAQQQPTNSTNVIQQQQQQQQPNQIMDSIKNNIEKFVAQPVEYKRSMLGQLIFPRVQQHLDKDQQDIAPKITGMLIDFTVFELQDILEFIENDQELKERVQEAEKLIKSQSLSHQ